MMKRLAFVILLAGLAWSGHWLWGWYSLSTAYEGWFAERRAKGWQADYADMAIRGFPNRHDTTWTELRLTDPESGIGWRAPFFQLFLLSYNRHHAIAAWPDRQLILTPEGEIEVTSDSLQASVITSGAEHALERANFAADVLNLTRGESTTALARLRAGVQRGEGAAYDLALSVEGLALPAALLRATGGALPETFHEARLQAQVTFDAPWTLGAAKTRPQPRSLDLTRAELAWGPMALRLAGDLAIDAAGRATGEVHLQARNWQEMLAVARASGRVSALALDGLEATLGLMAQFSGSPTSLDVTLTLDDGQMRLGPLPLGAAPRLVLP